MNAPRPDATSPPGATGPANPPGPANRPGVSGPANPPGATGAAKPSGVSGPANPTGPVGAMDPPGTARPDGGAGGTAPPLPRTLAARMLTGPIVAYRRWVSPALPARCRFYPSCSAYALEAIAVHGALRGTGLTLWRLLRCQPFHPGGYDPVPDRHHGSRCADADGTDRPAPPAARRARRTDATGAAT